MTTTMGKVIDLDVFRRTRQIREVLRCTDEGKKHKYVILTVIHKTGWGTAECTVCGVQDKVPMYPWAAGKGVRCAEVVNGRGCLNTGRIPVGNSHYCGKHRPQADVPSIQDDRTHKARDH